MICTLDLVLLGKILHEELTCCVNEEGSELSSKYSVTRVLIFLAAGFVLDRLSPDGVF